MGSMHDWIAGRARVRADRGTVRDTRGAAGLYDLASNDYLGLARDPRLAEASRRAVAEFGAGAAASRVVTGTLPVHDELESALRTLTGRDAALVFSSGYTANLGVLGALGGPGTLLVLDAHAHASLIDGARLSRSPVETARHNDAAHVRELLARRTVPRAVVVVESVYSVLGDAAPLRELARACRELDALLVVDEAHSLGVHGAGAVHAAGLARDPDVVVTATLSKALGAQGGAVLAAGPPAEALREHLVNTARTFLFDTGLAPGPAAAAAEAARIVASEPGLPGSLAERSDRIAAALAGPGFESGTGAVHSVRVGDAAVATAAAGELRARGIAVGCFRTPSVPDGVSRLRVTARANQNAADLDRALAEVADVLRRSDRCASDRPSREEATA